MSEDPIAVAPEVLEDSAQVFQFVIPEKVKMLRLMVLRHKQRRTPLLLFARPALMMPKGAHRSAFMRPPETLLELPHRFS